MIYLVPPSGGGREIKSPRVRLFRLPRFRLAALEVAFLHGRSKKRRNATATQMKRRGTTRKEVSKQSGGSTEGRRWGDSKENTCLAGVRDGPRASQPLAQDLIGYF